MVNFRKNRQKFSLFIQVLRCFVSLIQKRWKTVTSDILIVIIVRAHYFQQSE